MPELSIPAIKAKVDTGARTSALHAYQVEESGASRVRFCLHPLQRRLDLSLECTADIIDKRVVTDSGGHAEERYVIRSLLQLGPKQWPIELTLTRRDTMLFRMLLGREALKGRCIVDPEQSYRAGRIIRPAGLYQKKA